MLIPNHFILRNMISFDHFFLIFCNIHEIMNKMGVASHRLPDKYPQLPALLIVQTETPMWGIVNITLDVNSLVPIVDQLIQNDQLWGFRWDADP